MAEFEKVFCENRELVYRYLLRLCRSADIAEELTQETFFRAYINFAGIRDKERCSTWLCQTAKNCYYGWYNSRKRLAPLEEAASSVPGPEEQTERKALAEEAAKALSDLGEPYSSVFRLAAIAEVPLKEISRKYGKSESWARVTYYRARQMLTERIGAK